ncbi:MULTISPECIES: type II secretion system protein [Campylobacter]|uniref:type II secretion system protein n=1 Tax=Campylobacter TaxID=194 RepID=UPI000A339542|nr:MULTISPECIES: prepilin-type N-terminal cleavage/methylation domain-containing protein [unclassified Campylobacter]MBE6430165.1 prepilin-type N-terminal cleavage/methylation domain-containing protein [Campylobacter sp.]MBO5063847.1 prepilin-type N-terminal cleavage/methylation domain-containing protein [Campylobacter sp.]MBQ7136340.1 prepilin-type N-terminal cleavage/methylation domain-containing protein [Campylobacter sp.]
MRNAFTMIELVFVIVVLGILASIAVPRLVATKDDASAVTSATLLKDTIVQLTAYYTINGKLPAGELKSQSNLEQLAPTYKKSLDKNEAWIKCLNITLTSDSIEINNANIQDEPLCATLVKIPAVKEWIDNDITLSSSGIFK